MGHRHGRCGDAEKKADFKQILAKKHAQDLPKYSKKCAQNRLAIRTLFWAGWRGTESLGLQLEGMWCTGGSVLPDLFHMPAPFSVIAQEAAISSCGGWRTDGCGDGRNNLRFIAWQTTGQRKEPSRRDGHSSDSA